jgi:hypothetical protein
MKRSLFVITSLVLICASLHSQNTSPFWSLAGNSNATSASRLGTATWIPLRIVTNNLERVRVTPAGWVGIGTSAPTSLLTANIVSGSPLRAQIGGVTKFVVNNNGGASIGQPVAGPPGGLFVSGSVGIGTPTPSQKLHVAGTTLITNGLIVQRQQPVDGPFEETAITATSTIQDPSRGGITVGIGLFAEAGLAGVIARGVGAGPAGPFGVGVRAFGNAVGVIATSGHIGIYGTSTGDDFARGVEGFSELGIGGYFSSTNGFGLEAYSEHNYAGYFNGDVYATGIFETSDETLKENITPLTNAMEKINQLKPSFYEFKNDARFKVLALPKGSHYGLIAQDLEKVFPALVRETSKALHQSTSPAIDKQGAIFTQTNKQDNEKINIKAVNYTALIPILVRGIQEMDSIYKSEINSLKEEIAELKLAVNNSRSGNLFPSKATMKQNVPNPVLNTTTIGYFIPDGTSSARIMITDTKGQQLKVFNVSGDGSVNFSAGTLAAGTYSYSLVVDGQTISSKKMIIAK